MPARIDHPVPDWRDVEAAMREVASTHCCDLSLDLKPALMEGTPVLFWVRMTAHPRIVGRRTIRRPMAVSRRFPHPDHATVEGLALRLVYKLDYDLEEAGHVPAEQAAFPWDEK